MCEVATDQKVEPRELEFTSLHDVCKKIHYQLLRLPPDAARGISQKLSLVHQITALIVEFLGFFSALSS
jgi:hypothetical protein